MTDQQWEEGLREVMSGTAEGARIGTAPTDVIVRRGRSSARWRHGMAATGLAGVVAVAVVAGTSLGSSGGGAVSPIWKSPDASATTSPSASASPSASITSQPVVADSAVVVMGSSTAKTKVQIYDDYRCPACKSINDAIGNSLKHAAESGSIQIEYFPVNLIDRNTESGGNGSVAAGNAVQCAAEAGRFFSYRDALFAHQPGEYDDVYGVPSKLIEVAQAIPGLDTAVFENCVKGEPYAAGVVQNYDHLVNDLHGAGAPTIFIDGKQWNPGGARTPAEITQQFNDELTRAEAAH
ncbi:MAG: thioredoxin domain-containing protein [Catenulispora sp.]|nr:thioredoxin domain-containing protein [Catenulispora sp.]